jgi:predicted nucleic acid-binding protein
VAAGEVCVDASLVLKLVLREPDSELAEALFARWQADRVRLIAPAFCPVEVDSVIRRKSSTGDPARRLSPEQAEPAFQAVQMVPLRVVEEPLQRRRAWELAKLLELPVVYDSHYLALAELRGCEFWTADEKLYRTAKEKLNYVRLLAEHDSR